MDIFLLQGCHNGWKGWKGWNGWKGWKGWKFISFSGKFFMWLELDSLFCPLSVFRRVVISLYLSLITNVINEMVNVIGDGWKSWKNVTIL